MKAAASPRHCACPARASSCQRRPQDDNLLPIWFETYPRHALTLGLSSASATSYSGLAVPIAERLFTCELSLIGPRLSSQSPVGVP